MNIVHFDEMKRNLAHLVRCQLRWNRMSAAMAAALYQVPKLEFVEFLKHPEEHPKQERQLFERIRIGASSSQKLISPQIRRLSLAVLLLLDQEGKQNAT